MDDGPDEDETVPDGMRKWNDPVALEEDDACHIDETTEGQFVQPRHVLLRRNMNTQTRHTRLLHACRSLMLQLKSPLTVQRVNNTLANIASNQTIYLRN